MHVLYKNYGSNVDRIIKGRLREVFIFYRKVIEEKEDDRLYQLWTSLVPHMTGESYMSYNEYKRKVTTKPSSDSNVNGNKIDNSIQYSDKTENELIQEANDILNMDIGKVQQVEVNY